MMKIFSPQKPRVDDDPFVLQSGRFNLGPLSGRRQWPDAESVFAPTHAGGASVRHSFSLSRLSWWRVLAAVLFGVLLWRLYWLQITQGAYYRSLADGNRLRLQTIDANRGIIYDDQKKPLVRNVANFLLYFVPADLPKDAVSREALIKKVADILGDPSQQAIDNLLSKVDFKSLDAYQPLFIADNLAYDKAMAIDLASAQMPGVALSSQSRRQYDMSLISLSHVLGYTGKVNDNDLKVNPGYSPLDYIGKDGLEKYWETDLRGMPGVEQIEVDALGKEKAVISQTAPLDGHNLVLSLNYNAQQELEKDLANEMQKDKLTDSGGMAIVMDPNTGQIIAFVSWPSFDNNLFAQGISQTDYQKLLNDPANPLFQRISNGQYPSGSVIKPVVAAAALQEGVIDQNTSFLSTGGLRLNGQWFFPDWKAGGHGKTDVRKAIAQSVNTFFYIIGGGYQDFVGLGIDRLDKWFSLFDFGQKTGIDLPGEETGFIPTKDWKQKTQHTQWFVGDTYHVAIGQGDFLVTPLQIAMMTCYFANGGTLYRPYFVKQILSGDDQLLSTVAPVVLKSNLVSPQNVEIVREGMRQTITAGSAQLLKDVQVPVAGKTGTAQWSSTKPNHGWFTAFAPYDHPQVEITVMLEEGGEGTYTAAPVARNFLRWYFSAARLGTSTAAASTPASMSTQSQKVKSR